MNENIRLLMEETGCDQGEAELALELSSQDLQTAIRTIGSLLRHIIAIKGKFYFPQKNLYGLIIVVVNNKSNEILRLRTVVSYNPAIYENSPSMDWYAVEKQIFSYRLDEGSLPDYTQTTEQRLESCLKEKKDVLIKGDAEGIKKIIIDFFNPEEVVVDLQLEELNLDQFRKLPEESSGSNGRVTASGKDLGAVRLEIGLMEDPDGKEVQKLIEGDSVLSVIIDTRDIAHYLAHLIGNMQDGNMMPLPAVVRKVVSSEEGFEVHVSYAPGIVGVAKVQNNIKVRVTETEEREQSWWKKIISW